MELQKVVLQADVYMVCLQHALSTENFEVMGLLIGDNVEGVISISAVVILRRSDKKKDRVEISPDQLFSAATEAERLQKELQRTMRVVGWYHSHPHITVCPSHVDVGTQAMYQNMESSFIGLIFSVFTENKASKEHEVSLTCFQSHNNKSKEIPLEIIYTNDISIYCSRTMTELPKILAQEEEDMATSCKNNSDVLVSIHNNAVQTRALSHVTGVITKPLVQIFHSRLKFNEARIKYLEEQLEEYEKLSKQTL